MFDGISTVLFDLDGTLIDSAPDLGGAADDMRVARGLLSIALERYRPMAGAGARGMLGIAFGMSPEHLDYPAMREEFFQRYEHRMTANTHVFDGVAELLGALESRGLRWGIVTNKMERFTHPLVASVPLLASSAATVSGDTTPHSKPHPAPLLEAARRIGVDPAACLYVGDDERDVAAGLAAGMRTVAAAWGYLGSTTRIESWGAHSIACEPGQVLKLLDPA